MAEIQFSFFAQGFGELKSVVVLDATLSESSSYSATVTSYPVEKGKDISDHIRANPVQIDIEGVIVDAPLNAQAPNKDDRRTSTAIEALRQLQEQGRTCTLYLNAKVFESMALENFSFTRTKDTKGGLQVQLKFKEIRTVDRLDVEIKRAEARSKGKVSTGNQTATPATEEEAKKINQSALANFFF